MAVDFYLPALPGEKPCGGAVPEHALPRIPGFDAASLPAVVSPRAILENGRHRQVALQLGGIRIYQRADLDVRNAAAHVDAAPDAVERA